MSIILYHDRDQRTAAERSLDRIEEKRGGQVFTEIVPLDVFTEAEGYHQKYNLQNSKLFLDELERYYSDLDGIVDSTAAARINGYLGRYGTIEELQREIEDFGLSEEAERELLRRVGPPEPGRISRFFRSILGACGIEVGSN
jgi:peptide-methionine (S)-S-oxide reductase